MDVTNQDKINLIPLYLGITGHRDIRDEDKFLLKEEIKKIIGNKQIQCPDTPVVILTPLAEGADRLGAMAAIECGIPFIAPLPMPIEEYRKDFTDWESLEEFDFLLGKAKMWFEIPLPPGITSESLSKDPGLKNELYHNIGIYIARNSHLLIALWDGLESGKTGGTSSIVNLKRVGLPPVQGQSQNRLKNLQTGSICHIVTPRKNASEPEDKLTTKPIYSAYWEDNSEKPEELDNKLLSQIDSFNRDIKKLSSGMAQKIKISESYLNIHEPIVNCNNELLTIARLHSITDNLATYFQKRRFFALKLLLTLVVLAFMFFQLYVEFWHKPWILFMYPLTMGIGALWFMNASTKRFEQKHEDYRALSEAYRVQFFISLAERKTNVAEHYLQKHKGELEWVIYTLRASLLEPSAIQNKSKSNLIFDTSDRLKFIKLNWINDQSTYYRKKSELYHRTFEKTENVANLLFSGAIGSAILLFVLSVTKEHLPEFLENYEELIHSVLVICTHSFLVVSAAIHGYIEKMSFTEQAKTYNHMFQLFNIADAKVGKEMVSNNTDEANEIIWELALEALMENADWLILHRSHPLEMPKG